MSIKFELMRVGDSLEFLPSSKLALNRTQSTKAKVVQLSDQTITYLIESKGASTVRRAALVLHRLIGRGTREQHWVFE